MQAGTLSEAPLRQAVQELMQNQGVAAPLPWFEYWQVYKTRGSPEIVQWMEESVFAGNE